MKYINKLSVVILFLFFNKMALCQKEALIWYFGDSAGVSFECGIPKALTNSPMFSTEGNSSICDTSGNLLFFTNGGKSSPTNPWIGGVWNRNLELMPNGNLADMQGCNSSHQGSIIFPSPSDKDQYYLFTADCGEFGFAKGLSYAIIDMTLDGGNGDVVTKGNKISESNSESVHAVLHDNLRDYWVITSFGDSLIVFLVDSANGVAASPDKYYNTQDFWGVGEIKASPDRTKLYFAGDLYNFNASTGAISHIVDLNNKAPSCSFSPGSKLLYLGGIGFGIRIAQYNLEAGDIAASKVDISSFSSASYLSLAPDGKIYESRLSNKLSVIHNPDSVGLACSFEIGVVDLQGRNSFIALPNFPQHYFVNKIPADSTINDLNAGRDTSICLGDTVQLGTWDTIPNMVTIKWSPLSGFLSADTVPMPFASPVSDITYEVEATSLLSGCQVRDRVNIKVLGNDTADFYVRDLCLNDTVIFIDTLGVFDMWEWDFGEPSSINNNATGDSVAHSYNDTGTYTVSLIAFSNSHSCLRDTVIKEIVINHLPLVDIIEDTTICAGNLISIGGVNISGYQYSWIPASALDNPNISNPMASVGQNETFRLEVTDTNNCTNSDSLIISVFAIPIVDIKANDEDDSIVILKNEKVIIDINIENIDSFYLTNTFNQSVASLLNQEIYPNESSMYYVYGVNSCELVVDSVYILVFDSALVKVPTVFSPNNDGMNEVFIPFYEFITELEYLKVFNRWGDLVFQTQDITEGWDGTYDGTPQQTGMYLFELKGVGLDQSVLSEHGNIFLIR